MKCEFCNREHDGSYGTGRFCNRTCHSKSNNAKMTKETRVKITESRLKNLDEKYETISWDKLPKTRKYERVMSEQEKRCGKCKINEWAGQPIELEIHHIDGDRKNNGRKNLIYLCRNCHSQTGNFCYRNSK